MCGRHLSLIVTAALTASLPAPPVMAQAIDALEWVSRCQSLREELANDPQTAVSYGDWPSVPPMTPLWQISLNGFTVPLPVLTYSEVLLMRDPGQPVGVIVVAEDGTNIVVSSLPVAPLDDVFTLTTWRGTESMPATREWSHQIFGGPVDLGQLTNLGYLHRPSDLTCAAADWQREIPISIALGLKAAGPGRMVSVYRRDRVDRGWITERRVDDLTIWEATRSEPGRVWFATISAAADGPFQDIGLAFDRSEVVDATDPPNWLERLAHAFEQPEEVSRWAALAASFEDSGLSPRSVESARTLAEQ